MRAGVDLDIRPIIDGQERLLEPRYNNLLPYVNREDNNYKDWPDVVMVHAIPYGCNLLLDQELAPPPHVKRVAISTWETSHLPYDIAKELAGMFDQVWMCSEYSASGLTYWKDLFKPKQVKVVPHAFDPEFWSGHVRCAESSDSDPYTFYTILTWMERKNPLGLLKAYLTEFTEEDNVLLKIRTPSYNEAEIDELIRGLKLKYLPPVDMLCAYMTEEEMLNLHLTSDCYVTVARAEGFGLGAYESALMGNPVIASKYSGLREFLDDYALTTYVPVFETPAYTPESHIKGEINVLGLNIKPMSRNDHIGISADQNWSEPDLNTLKKEMRAHYKGFHEVDDSTKEEERQRLAKYFSYDVIGARVKSYLEELVGVK